MSGLLHQSETRGFFLGYAASQLGSGMRSFVLPVIMLATTGSASLTAAVVAVEVAPSLVFGLVGGAVADRRRLLTTLVLTDSLIAATMVAAALAARDNRLAVLSIFTVAAVTASASVFRDAAIFGAVRVIGGRDSSAGAASLLQTTGALSTVLGPLLAGLLISADTIWVIFALDACGYLIALIGFVRSRHILDGRPQPDTSEKLLTSIREGWSALWQHQALRQMTLVVAITGITGGAVLSLIAPLVVDNLDVPPESGHIALVVAVGNIGAVAGAIALHYLLSRLGPGKLALFCPMLVAVLSLALLSTKNLAFMAAVYACWQAVFTVTITNGIAIRLQLAPVDYVSRVNMAARMVAWGGQPIGAGAAALLSFALPPSGTVALLTIPAIVAFALALAWRTGKSVARAILLANEEGTDAPA